MEVVRPKVDKVGEVEAMLTSSVVDDVAALVVSSHDEKVVGLSSFFAPLDCICGVDT
jgi:hypothetical protein